MQTNYLVTPLSNPSAQTALGLFKRKFSVVIAVFFLSSITCFDSAVAAPSLAAQKPDSSSIAKVGGLTIAIDPNLSLLDYQECLSKAMDIIGSGACDTASNVRFCIKAVFVSDRDQCSLYL